MFQHFQDENFHTFIKNILLFMTFLIR